MKEFWSKPTCWLVAKLLLLGIFCLLSRRYSSKRSRHRECIRYVGKSIRIMIYVDCQVPFEEGSSCTGQVGATTNLHVYNCLYIHILYVFVYVYYICICIYIYYIYIICVCTYIYIYIYMVCTYIYIYMCVYIYIFTYACIYIFIYLYIYVCVCVHIYIYIHMCVCACIRLNFPPIPPGTLPSKLGLYHKQAGIYHACE